jgi:hypothetical protein
MGRYLAALEALYQTQGLVPVVFERNSRSQHLQLQVVPIPAAAAAGALAAIADFGASIEFPFQETDLALADLAKVRQHGTSIISQLT